MYPTNENPQPKLAANPMSEHVSVANDMSSHICEYPPEKQLEMLRVIKDRMMEEREIRLEGAEKALEHEKTMYKNATDECRRV